MWLQAFGMPGGDLFRNIVNQRLARLGIVKGGNINRLNLCQRQQSLPAAVAPVGLQHFDHLGKSFFGLADKVEIDEIGHRFRVEADRATGRNQRIIFVSFGREQRNPGQVEHIE